MPQIWQGKLEKIDDFRWRIPKNYKPGMRVDGIIYADEKMISQIKQDQAPEQVANVAHLPGIVKYSLAMPDIHWGYGMPIGGVAAFDTKVGIIGPGMIGYDINCGVRLVKSDLSYDDIKDKIKEIVHALYITIPAGVGSKGEIKVSHQEEKQIMIKGAKWAVDKGYGVKEDLEHCEEKGRIEGANPDKVSQRAFERGKAQAGTLGSGNHFLEVQVVDQIYDSEIANKLGIYLGSITIMIHTGSRGFGYQICDDYLRVMSQAVGKYGIKLPDRQLACAPVNSKEAQDYIQAMRCAANYAWANRQCITYLVRKAFEKVFNKSWESLGLNLIYDVCHNIAKFEKHKVNGEEKTLCVHRKGATRAFPPNHPDLSEDYKEIGQPVIIPGDMGRNSYLLIGLEKAEETFYSTCHGAGRVMSRSKAVKQGRGRSIAKELERQGIIVMAKGRETLSEEMPEAYKDVNDVVNVVDGAGISKKICRMRPLGVVKG